MLLVTALMFMTVVSSCSNDNDSEAPDSLVGTTWKGTNNGWEAIVKFVDNSSFTCTETRIEDGHTNHYSGTYSYNKPVCTGTLYGYEFTATISGNKCTVIVSGSGNTYIFHKQ